MIRSDYDSMGSNILAQNFYDGQFLIPIPCMSQNPT